MTQCIIPGCEEHPDPATVINVDPTKPMKEIPMSETKSNINNNDAFKNFIAAGSAIVQSGRELMEENARLRNDVDWFNALFGESMLDPRSDNIRTILAMGREARAFGCGGVVDLSERLRHAKDSEPPSDYQTLKDFKAEMDAIHEEFDIPHDVEELRKALSEWKTCKEACDSNRVDPDELNKKLEELDAIKNVMDNKDISDADDLDDYLDEVADFQKYKNGFEELSDFVEKIKEVIGSHGDDIPSTDVEDYD